MASPTVGVTRVAFALLAAAVAPGALQGQGDDAWPYPRRVRVATSTARFVGRVVGWDGERLAVAVGGDTAAVAFADITRLEFSRGRGRDAGQYTAVGLVIGAAIGAIGGALHGDVRIGPDCEGDYCVESGAVVFGLAGGAIGAGMGFIAGMVSERWEPFDTDRLSVGLGGITGLGIVFSLAFGS